MLFNSLEFLLFFPLVLIINYILPRRKRYIWLLIASYFFYMSWNAAFALLMLLCTLTSYSFSIHIENLKYRRQRNNETYQKFLLGLGCVIHLSLLFFFKYFNFTVELTAALFSKLNLQVALPNFDILLPVGISFFTFQSLGYMVDVYREEIYAEKNFFRYALFISFFPQLVAGPIERSGNMLYQLKRAHRFNFERCIEGFLIMLWGFFLKIVLADRIAILVDAIYQNPQAATGAHIVVATLLFAIQIYCDFYGYSSIAIGSSKILGIRLMENFHAPYFSTSVSVFWRNWHISLTSWFKDYLYIPLGGSHKGSLRKYINKMIVFLLSGLWHGAAGTFVIWGGINGLYQIIGELLSPFKRRFYKKIGLRRKKLPYKILAGFTTFVLIDFSWIFFRANSLSDALFILKNIVNNLNLKSLFDHSIFSYGLNSFQFILIAICIAILFVADTMKHRGIRMHKWINSHIWFRWVCIALGIFVILLFGIWGPEYNQANFIYFQF